MIWKYLLRIWGWVCLLAAALHGALTLYAAAVPYNIYQPGSTGIRAKENRAAHPLNRNMARFSGVLASKKAIPHTRAT